MKYFIQQFLQNPNFNSFYSIIFYFSYNIFFLVTPFFFLITLIIVIALIVISTITSIIAYSEMLIASSIIALTMIPTTITISNITWVVIPISTYQIVHISISDYICSSTRNRGICTRRLIYNCGEISIFHIFRAFLSILNMLTLVLALNKSHSQRKKPKKS